MVTFPTDGYSYAVFGRGARAYGGLINAIIPRISKESYVFEEIFEFLERSSSRPDAFACYRKIYWSEMLSRSHLASVAA
jgi:hypothetical protein